MSASLLLARHAAHADLGRRLTGRGSEAGLSTVGRAQAAELAESLRGEPIAAVYSSPRLRTLQTAQAIAAPHNLPVQVSDALDEIDFGVWTGCSFDELDGQPEWDRWNRARGSARCPGGESMREAQERAAQFLDEVRAVTPAGQVVAVTHCDIIRALLCREHGRSLDEILTFEAEPASVIRLRSPPQRAAA